MRSFRRRHMHHYLQQVCTKQQRGSQRRGSVCCGGIDEPPAETHARLPPMLNKVVLALEQIVISALRWPPEGTEPEVAQALDQMAAVAVTAPVEDTARTKWAPATSTAGHRDGRMAAPVASRWRSRTAANIANLDMRQVRPGEQFILV